MNDDPKFTLFWRTGEREVIQGRTIAEVLAGYGGGWMPDLAFWADGDDTSWVYAQSDGWVLEVGK